MSKNETSIYKASVQGGLSPKLQKKLVKLIKKIEKESQKVIEEPKYELDEVKDGGRHIGGRSLGGKKTKVSKKIVVGGKKKRQASAFAMFVKEHMPEMAELGIPHKEKMAKIAEMWNAHKASRSVNEL